MQLGKLTLALHYSPRQIDRDIPTFYRELLIAWQKHQPLRTRSHIPNKLPDVLNEPLFQNDLITIDNQPLAHSDWVASGITQVKDICYEAIPGYLPTRAIHELLTEQEDDNTRTLSRTTREFNELKSAIPQEWTLKINSQNIPETPDLQPRFVISDSTPNNAPQDILSYKTRTFYGQLLKEQQCAIPALDFWKRNLQPQPTFNAKQWKTLYSPLILNKHGDMNWKIAHRVLPTALSLNRIGVYATTNCHRCGLTDTLEHALIECPSIDHFWKQIQVYVDKLTDHKLSITTQLKMLGIVKRENDALGQRIVDLVNWTLTVARWAIHKSAVSHRVRNMTIPPEAIFRATVKSHLQFQYKLYLSRHTQYYFPYHWCIGETFAKVENDTLIFTF